MDLARILPEVEKDRRQAQSVTMAESVLSDGQRLLGVNDLFIGPRTHTSARYEIELGEQKERQSSSGIIVSTGLARRLGRAVSLPARWRSVVPMDRRRVTLNMPGLGTNACCNSRSSRTSQTGMVFGRVGANEKLTLRSLTPENGVIFCDGIEADFLGFSSGMVASIGVADRSGRLVL